MGGGSKTSSSQNSTSSNAVNPQELAMLQDNYAGAQGRANSLTPYSGPLTAGFNPTQTQAQGVLSTVATNPQYAANNNMATGAVQGVLGSPISAQPYASSQLSNTDLAPYMNPYTNDVVNASIAQNERARQTANMNDNQAATGDGAFGGSRSGVANALTNEAYDRNNQVNIANLNSANYGQAQTAASADLAAQNQAKQFNSTQGVSTGFNNANLQLTGANDLANLNNNGLNLAAQQGSILGAVGDQQQQQSQAELSNAYNAYLQGQQLTMQQQQLLNSALGLIPNQQTITSNGSGTQNTSNQLGVGSILGGLGSLASGLGGSSGILALGAAL